MKFFIIIALSVALCMAAPAEDAQILRYEVSGFFCALIEMNQLMQI